jgi:hypothetical protein
MPRTATPPRENEDGVKGRSHERHSLVALGHPPSHEELYICRMDFTVR